MATIDDGDASIATTQSSNLFRKSELEKAMRDVVREFLSAGADINAPRGDGSCATPLHIAIDNSKDAIAEELVKCGASLALVDVHKRSPLGLLSAKEGDTIMRRRRILQCIGREPRWAPDDATPGCMICSLAFSTTLRRHHCRMCGRLICGSCSNSRASLQWKPGQSVRVCVECYDAHAAL